MSVTYFPVNAGLPATFTGWQQPSPFKAVVSTVGPADMRRLKSPKWSTHAESLKNTDLSQLFPHSGTLADVT